MQRRSFLLGSLAAAVAATACEPFTPVYTGETRTYGSHVLRRQQPRAGAPNVLFVGFDDQNDWLGFLNPHPGTHTPNADALAAQSIVFRNAYCAAPMCLPSRTAMLYGRHPFETGVYDHSTASRTAYANQVVDQLPTFIDDFWAAGYDTFGAGKIFGNQGRNRFVEYRTTPFYVSPVSRSDPALAGRFDPTWINPYDGTEIGDGTSFNNRGIDFGPSGGTATSDPDGGAAAWAQQVLGRTHDRPFFLGLGIVLPHVPWRLPQEFFDLHPLDEVQPPPFLPDDLDDLSAYARDSIVDTHKTFEYIHGQDRWREAVQAAQAATSYCDWMLGQVLDALAASPYADDTIVVLWSDHGFHLGEKLHFRKFTLWEPGTHVPFVIRTPGQTTGIEVDQPVSLVDMGPTLTAMANVPMSMPSSGGNIFSRMADPSRFDQEPPVMTWLEGNHAVRRGTWRYIRYSTGDVELYDLATDPQELTNLGGRPEHAALLAELDAYLPPPPAGAAAATDAAGTNATGPAAEGSQPDLATMLSDPSLDGG